MNKTNDIQETRAALDEIIANVVAKEEKAGVTVYEYGDLMEATDVKAFRVDDNLFITKRSLLHALGKLGWRSRLFEYTQKDRAVMEELARVWQEGFPIWKARELILEKRDFNGMILTEADIKKSLESIWQLTRFPRAEKTKGALRES